MGGRIVDLLSSPHLAAEAMVPWLLNDTLAPAERRELEAHLQSCSACRAELERQRELMSLYGVPLPGAPSAAGVPTDSAAALAHLLDRLDADATPPAPAAVRPARASAKTSFVSLRWWPLAVALQLGVIIALGATLWIQITASGPAEGGAAYRGLSSSSPRDPGDALVVFDPAASEADLRRALVRAGARIVDGPTAAGAYVVRFERETTQSQAALDALRADGAVRRAESLAPAGR